MPHVVDSGALLSYSHCELLTTVASSFDSLKNQYGYTPLTLGVLK